MVFKNQTEMFNWIWENRPHKSEISGKPLHRKGHLMWHWQFAHILGKQAYPGYKLNPDNIMLMLPEEHHKQESFPYFIEKKEELIQKYYQERQIKKL